MSAAWPLWLRDPALQLALHAGGALLFAASAWHKRRDPGAFRSAVAGYRLLPPRLVGPAAALVPAAEAGVALALLVPAGALPGSLGGAALLVLYAVAVAANLARGRRHIDCGCGGAGGARPLSAALVVRNLLLAGALLVAAAPADARALTWLDGISGVGLTLSLASLYAALDVALAQGARSLGEGTWSTS